MGGDSGLGPGRSRRAALGGADRAGAAGEPDDFDDVDVSDPERDAREDAVLEDDLPWDDGSWDDDLPWDHGPAAAPRPAGGRPGPIRAHGGRSDDLLPDDDLPYGEGRLYGALSDDTRHGPLPYGDPPDEAPYRTGPSYDGGSDDARRPYGSRAGDGPSDAPSRDSSRDGESWDDDPGYRDADELPRLMARLGRLIARHGAGGVVAMARTEAERRELMAYAAGWQDAAADFAARAAAARRDGLLGRWRPPRVLSGPGDVIPFPMAMPYGRRAEPEPLPDHGTADDGDLACEAEEGTAVRGGEGAGAHDAEEAGEGQDAGKDPGAGRTGRPGQPGSGQRPALQAKSRRSRSPTIPRLVPPQRLPARGPDGGPPPPPDPPA